MTLQKPTSPMVADLNDRIRKTDGPLRGQSTESLVSLDAGLFKIVRVMLNARLGALSLNLEEVLALKAGTVLSLDRPISEPIEILLNEQVVARGEIVVVDNQFAVRLIEVAAR